MVAPESPVRIAGAGPAGLSCAIALARGGRKAVVSEAEGTVGARFLGEFQILENFSEEADIGSLLEEIGIEGDFLGPGLTEAELFDSRLRHRRVRSERPFAYWLRRGPQVGTLDSSLLGQARAAGVDVRFRERLKPGEAAVEATGPQVPDLVARVMTFRTGSAERVQFLFDSRRAPGGHGYFFAHSGFATLGCAVSRDFANIDRHFDRCARRFREISDYSVSEERIGYDYSSRVLPETGQLEGTLLAGEAGGFQDFLLGLGLRYALGTGLLAARSILEGRSYDALCEERFGARQRSALGVHWLYEVLGDSAWSRFLRRSGGFDFRDYLRRWSRPAFRKEVLALLARLAWPRGQSCSHSLPDHWCRGGKEEPFPARGKGAGDKESLPLSRSKEEPA